MSGINWTELTIFTVLFLAVAGVGFVAARWRRPASMHHLDEWGLGGRNFGAWVTWFLIGGDLYTAYTFVAVPALLFGAGAVGFFAMPYTVITYPLVFLVLIRLWSVSHRHGFVTPADFVRARFGSPTLALLVALTGIVATMPYIALQLIGIEAVLKSMGMTGDTFAARHLPLIIAFAILAAYTYQSGLRAPALIAFVKDTLIYAVIMIAVLYIPYKLGGWGVIFDAADHKFGRRQGRVLLPGHMQLPYITLAFGSSLALFLYPHSVTGVLACKNRDIIKRNMAALPAYSLLFGLIALLGYMAIAAGVEAHGDRWQGRPQHRGAGAVRPHVPGLVRRHRVRRDRDRRTGAGGDHVDRGGQPVHPQHLQGVPAPRRDSGRGGAGVEAGVAGGQVRRAAVHRGHQSAVLDRPAAHRRRHHPADPAGGGAGAVHPLVPPGRADRGLAGRHGRRAVDALRPRPTRRPPRPLRRLGVLARQAGLDPGTSPSTPGFVAVLVNLVVGVVATVIARAAGWPDGQDATAAGDYYADEGDPRVAPAAMSSAT